MRRRLGGQLPVAALLAATVSCGGAASGADDVPSPRYVTRVQAGTPVNLGRCGSWIGPGVAAAFCAAGIETPAPNGEKTGQIRFTGTPRSGSEGGIAQAGGTLPEGRSIGIKVESGTHGTLVAQGVCGRTEVRASFRDVTFRTADDARLQIVRSGGTPVILLRQNGHAVPPDREVLINLFWMPHHSSAACGFTVA
jgi:hypothetical protein